ncbi:MAG TPA: hypothetical protein VFF45_00515 [Bacilli bacterium]|nr:hypothetical protein [Bacilli bacterium]
MAHDTGWAAAILVIAALPGVLLPCWLTWAASIAIALMAGVTSIIVTLQHSGVAGCPGCGARIWGLSLSGDNVGKRPHQEAGAEARVRLLDRCAEARGDRVVGDGDRLKGLRARHDRTRAS